MGDFTWTQHPAAAAAIDELIANAVSSNAAVADLERRLGSETSTSIINWLDHISGPISVERLTELGFVDGFQTQPGIWRHPGAQLPAVIPADSFALALRVDDVVNAAQAFESAEPIEGSALCGFRRVELFPGVFAVERRSWGAGVEPVEFDDSEELNAHNARLFWHERKRANAAGPDAVAAMQTATQIAQAMVHLVGADLAASYVLEIEREYWQRRNTAGVVQFARQDRLGLGWGNNDHHTFRSSRTAFGELVRLFNVLGFESRERFYAGEEAGWGAQVLEHPGCGGVLFTDVDLGVDEVGMDFTTIALPEQERYGTVGMWCALHGESILNAGMHHLEGQFEFDQLQADLSERGIGHMKPFSNFNYLRQAFTAAEKWPVSTERLTRLVNDGHLTDEKADDFEANGAAGSHLENLQRREGFKGFNQRSVSDTMRVTDPRNL